MKFVKSFGLGIIVIIFFKSRMMDPDACGKRDSLFPYMQKLEELLKENKSTKIAFYNESNLPDLFRSDADETHRIATTGDTAESVIFFNIDCLSNLTIEQTTAILYHELSHHVGLKDAQLRVPDQIGSRVAQHVSRNLVNKSFSDGIDPQCPASLIPGNKSTLPSEFLALF